MTNKSKPPILAVLASLIVVLSIPYCLSSPQGQGFFAFISVIIGVMIASIIGFVIAIAGWIRGERFAPAVAITLSIPTVFALICILQ